MAKVEKQYVQIIFGISCKLLKFFLIYKEKKKFVLIYKASFSTEITEPFIKIVTKINDLCKDVLY